MDLSARLPHRLNTATEWNSVHLSFTVNSICELCVSLVSGIPSGSPGEIASIKSTTLASLFRSSLWAVDYGSIHQIGLAKPSPVDGFGPPITAVTPHPHLSTTFGTAASLTSVHLQRSWYVSSIFLICFIELPINLFDRF